MDKGQAIYDFWSSFGVPAYDENTVPDDAPDKKITFAAFSGSIGDFLPSSGSVWDKSTSWEWVSKKVDEISAAIGPGFMCKSIDGGYMVITRGSPFAQRMSDPSSDSIRRMYLNINVEYLTAF